jgi:hypothetical protein
MRLLLVGAWTTTIHLTGADAFRLSCHCDGHLLAAGDYGVHRRTGHGVMFLGKVLHRTGADVWLTCDIAGL